MSDPALHPGGCPCGALRYTLRGPLGQAYACHCRACQKQTSSAFSFSLPIALADLTLEGAPAVIERPTAAGAVTRGHLCPRCGGRLFHSSSRDPAAATLKVGSLDDPRGLRPAAHLWVREKLPWVLLEPGVPTFDTQPADLAAWRTDLRAGPRAGLRAGDGQTGG